MALSRPLNYEDHLLVHELGNNRAAGVNYVVERPAGDGLPEVIRIVDEGEGDGAPPLFEEDGHQLMEMEEEDEDEDSDDDEGLSDWTSEDSGYDSMYEDEEDFEDDDDVRPRSSLNQQFPQDNYFQGWRHVYPPVGVSAAAPVAEPLDVLAQQLIVGLLQVPVLHQELPGQQVEPPEESLPSFSQESEECAPSTSGLGSSTKRSREESYGEQVSFKRPRWNSEESHEESAPSTSGLSIFTNRSREEDYKDSVPSTSGLSIFTNRSREEDYKDSVPSTSGLWVFRNRSREEGYKDSVPSTSGLGSSTKRSREESHGEQVSFKRPRWNCEESHEESAPSSSGLSIFTNRSREEDYKDSVPSTSGLGSSIKRNREESYREQVSIKRPRWNCEESQEESAPSTSGLNSSTNRRYWPGPFEYQMWADDSDSD